MILDQTSSVSFPCFSNSFLKYLLRTLKDPESVLCVKLFAAIGSTPGEVPPHIIDIDALGAIAVLLENLYIIP